MSPEITWVTKVPNYQWNKAPEKWIHTCSLVVSSLQYYLETFYQWMYNPVEVTLST